MDDLTNSVINLISQINNNQSMQSFIDWLELEHESKRIVFNDQQQLKLEAAFSEAKYRIKYYSDHPKT